MRNYSSDPLKLLKKLIIEIVKFLDQKLQNPEQREILIELKNISLESENFALPKPTIPPKGDALRKALSSIKKKSLIGIKEALIDSLTYMRWNIDNGSFYDKNSNIGIEYLKGNMNAELIGPKNGNFWSADYRLGLFLLEPHTFYKDHNHAAPELYINLTDGTHWRFKENVWKEKRAGSIVYNEPYQVHAMKVNHEPFLSIWCWPYDSAQKCIVVTR